MSKKEGHSPRKFYRDIRFGARISDIELKNQWHRIGFGIILEYEGCTLETSDEERFIFNPGYDMRSLYPMAEQARKIHEARHLDQRKCKIGKDKIYEVFQEKNEKSNPRTAWIRNYELGATIRIISDD